MAERTIADLEHTYRQVSGGGDVFVLNNGALISAESEAMIQALHSRSVGGFLEHLRTLAERGSDKFMSSFYVGYGHKSIGDCGTATLFIEDVSMLVAKAIQDSRLYSGQEASTRYIDFSEQRFVNPLGTVEGERLLERQREFYLSAIDETVAMLKSAHPIGEGEKPTIYDKAINARAFDITRGFLPAGASTNLAWHGNLRQIGDRLLFLRHHPLQEVRNVADAVESAVLEAYPNSFHHKKYEATEAYQKQIAEDYFYHNPETPSGVRVTSNIDRALLERYRHLFTERPEKTELPKFLSDVGRLEAEFPLDFGSFRDIQRQRSISQRMPLLTAELGFNEWYLNSLPDSTRASAEAFLFDLEGQLNGLDCSPEDKQYYTPMGYNTSNKISGDLPAMAYVVELRATRFVHPTLRSVAQDIGAYMQTELGIPLHIDSTPDRFEIQRGEQDIVKKEK